MFNFLKKKPEEKIPSLERLILMYAHVKELREKNPKLRLGLHPRNHILLKTLFPDADFLDKNGFISIDVGVYIKDPSDYCNGFKQNISEVNTHVMKKDRSNGKY